MYWKIYVHKHKSQKRYHWWCTYPNSFPSCVGLRRLQYVYPEALDGQFLRDSTGGCWYIGMILHRRDRWYCEGKSQDILSTRFVFKWISDKPDLIIDVLWLWVLSSVSLKPYKFQLRYIDWTKMVHPGQWLEICIDSKIIITNHSYKTYPQFLVAVAVVGNKWKTKTQLFSLKQDAKVFKKLLSHLTNGSSDWFSGLNLI